MTLNAHAHPHRLFTSNLFSSKVLFSMRTFFLGLLVNPLSSLLSPLSPLSSLSSLLPLLSLPSLLSSLHCAVLARHSLIVEARVRQCV